jgi:predicted ester cyclase
LFANRRIETTFWDLHRFNRDGLIAETWNIIDRLAIMQQLKAGRVD